MTYKVKNLKYHSKQDIQEHFAAVKEQGIMRETQNTRDFNGLVAVDAAGVGYLVDEILSNAYYEFYLGHYVYEQEEGKLAIQQLLIRDRANNVGYITEVDLKAFDPVLLFIAANKLAFKPKTDNLKELAQSLEHYESVVLEEYSEELHTHEAIEYKQLQVDQARELFKSELD